MPLGCKKPYPTALPDARRRSRESRGARLLARLPAKHVPTPQPKTSAEEKQNAGCCGVFPPGRRGVGWELALVPENARERRGPVRDSAGLCGMLPGGHRDTEGFSKGSSTSLGLNASLFHSRSADVAPALQVRGCLLLTGASGDLNNCLQRVNRFGDLCQQLAFASAVPFAVIIPVHKAAAHPERKSLLGPRSTTTLPIQLSAGESLKRSRKPSCSSLHPFSVILYYHPPCQQMGK